MTRTNRILIGVGLVLVPAFLIAEGITDDQRSWSFSQRFQGTSNSAGVVLKTSSTATYQFNQHVRAYTGVPVYFARQSSASGGTAFMNGLGNVYSGLLVTAENPALRYSSDLMATFPTGDQSRGFSTGHPTLDWTNTFSHSFAAVTPYASIGIANTISDTSFFVRPFTSKGMVSHFEAGALFDVAPHVTIGGSGYGIRATGEQQIISKVVEQPAPQQTATSQPQSSPGGVLPTIVKNTGLGNTPGNSGKDSERLPPVFETQQQTLGPAAVANDHGFSTWVTLRPSHFTDFQIGYSRSMTYQFNSVFFGVGFRFGH